MFIGGSEPGATVPCGAVTLVPGSAPCHCLLLQAVLCKDEPTAAQRILGALFGQTGVSEHLHCLKQVLGDGYLLGLLFQCYLADVKTVPSHCTSS